MFYDLVSVEEREEIVALERERLATLERENHESSRVGTGISRKDEAKVLAVLFKAHSAMRRLYSRYKVEYALVSFVPRPNNEFQTYCKSSGGKLLVKLNKYDDDLMQFSI